MKHPILDTSLYTSSQLKKLADTVLRGPGQHEAKRRIFDARIHIHYSGTILRASDYGSNGKTTFYCTTHDHRWLAFTDIVVNGRVKGCPTCGNESRSDSHRSGVHSDKAGEYSAWLATERPLLETLDPYVTCATPIRHRCKKHNHIWLRAPRLKAFDCTHCRYERVSVSQKSLTVDDLTARIQEVSPCLSALTYVRQDVPIAVMCGESGKTFSSLYGALASGATPCPFCQPRGRRKSVTIHGREMLTRGYEHHALPLLLADKRRKLTINDVISDNDRHQDFPRFKYSQQGVHHTYTPDFYVPKRELIVEVKSTYTAGLLDMGRFDASHWKRLIAKRKAVVQEGYTFKLMLMADDGSEIGLPTNWHELTRKQAHRLIA